MNDRPDLQQVTEALAELLNGVFDALDALVARTAQLLEQPRTISTDLADLDTATVDVVRDSRLIVGAGYVAAPAALLDTDYWLQWWSDYDVPRTGEPKRLKVELDPDSELFRDYTELPWFAVPAGSGHRHITGPYVDYLCTDEDTLTFTVPVLAHGRFAGVVGADVYVREIERRALPCLGRLGAPAVLVNATNRVVVAVGSPYVPGDLVPTADLNLVDSAVLQISQLPFAVLLGHAVAERRAVWKRTSP